VSLDGERSLKPKMAIREV
jgi:phospholipid-translocating ATPase